MRFAFINDSVNFRTIDPSGLHFHYNIQNGVSDAVEKIGCQGHYYDDTLSLTQFVRERAYAQYDGIVLLSQWSSPAVMKARCVLAQSVPCVSVTTETIGCGGPYVGSDETAAVDGIIAHLVREGFRTIGYAGTRFQSYSLRRYAAFRAARRHHGLASGSKHLFGPAHDYFCSTRRLFPARADDISRFHDLDLKHELALMERILHDANRPEVMLFETDLAANLFYTCAQKAGVRIPEDIAIAGIDGNRILFGERGYHFLTTAEQDFYDIGRTAVRVLYDAVTGRRRHGAARTLIPPRIVVRASSRSAAKLSDDAGFKNEVAAAIERGFAAEDLARQIADDCMLSRRYFLIKFKKVFGEDFTEFMNNYRIDRAAFYLRHTDKPVSDILWDTGYHNHQNFNKFFKRRTGFTPTAYRRRAD